MSTKFKFVEIPEELYSKVGPPDPETRIYRKQGASEEAARWFEDVGEIAGGCVSPGGACMFAPVSRAAVHKRMKEGRISAFLYHTTHQRTSLFGKVKYKRNTPVVLIPSSELKAWREELEERAIRLGRITREELEGTKPDEDGDFMEWSSKFRKEKLEKDGVQK